MKTRDDRDKKWESLEEKMADMMEEARRRYLLANDFQEMEQITLEVGQRLQQELLQAGAEQREMDAPPDCPECGERMHKKGKTPRQLKTSVGKVKIERERWQCPGCGEALFPPR